MVVVLAGSGGCAAVVLVPRAIGQLSEGPDAPTGLEYHRSEGATASGEPVRIRHFVDPAARRRFVVVLVSGRLFSSRADDLTRDLDTTHRLYGALEGKPEAAVRDALGAPAAATRFEEVSVLWYVSGDDAFALVFLQGRWFVAFRLDAAEMQRMLRAPEPYAARGATGFPGPG